MNKFLAGLFVCGLTIFGTSVFAVTDMLELGLEEINNNTLNDYIDIIQTDTSPDVSNMNIVFGTGTQADFNSSTYYYFYQVENFTQGFIFVLDGFTLSSLDPLSIKSAGYFVSEDIDSTSTFNHNIPFEHESPNALIVDPVSMQITANAITWNFSPPPAPVIPFGDESTVLFITSDINTGQGLALASGFDSAFESDVILPTQNSVPEPSAMILFGIGIVAYARKRFWR